MGHTESPGWTATFGLTSAIQPLQGRTGCCGLMDRSAEEELHSSLIHDIDAEVPLPGALVL